MPQIWHRSRSGPHAPRAFNARCCPELSDLILRMLSVSPEARGSARELAEALEDAARRAGPETDSPLWAQAAPWLMQGRSAPQPLHLPAPVSPPRPSQPWRAWSLALAVTLVLVLESGHWQPSPSEEGQARPMALQESDGGSAAVADAALDVSGQSSHARGSSKRIALKLPSKPLPGQAVPDDKGRCQGSTEVALNGGCWVRLHVETLEKCDKEYNFEYQGGCYLPMFRPIRIPVSGPPPEDPHPRP